MRVYPKKEKPEGRETKDDQSPGRGDRGEGGLEREKKPVPRTTPGR